jgi:4-hydroxythreonine-4-phosphate dehydrogenase
MGVTMPDPSHPRIAVTLGDPAGVGPEVALKALADEAVRGLAPVAVFGPSADRWAELAGGQPAFLTGSMTQDAWDGQLTGTELVQVDANLDGLSPSRPSQASGEASIRYILAAVEAAKRGWIDAIVTGPISKEAIRLAGYPWPGHTELLAEQFGTSEVAMMLAGGPFRVVLVTIHVALAEAIRSITAERIVAICRLGSEAVHRWFGVEVPRLGVCGLNPHAGEAGRFGHEEREIIGPAIEDANAAGLCAFGPLPPDTAFHQAMQGKFDLVVAMYHDQGLIPIKTVAFEESVNVTLGLPIVRTSVDHGTAYDIAGRSLANPTSMKAALRLAVEMIGRGRAAERP